MSADRREVAKLVRLVTNPAAILRSLQTA